MTRKEAKAILENDIVGGHVEGNARFMDAFWMAVDALSQEPCEDAVSRQAVLDEINRVGVKGFETYTDYSQLYDFVDTLPSVTQKCEKCAMNGSSSKYCDNCVQKSGKWIPVSERLPEENKQVLIQYRTRYRDDVNIFDVTSRSDYNYWQGIGREIDVIAWMPLPEPYEPQESEKINCKSTKCENCKNHNYCDFEPQESEDKE